MPKPIIIIISLWFFAVICLAQRQNPSFKPIAVVELFTSEGCSSCPPADKLLTKLTEDAEKSHLNIYTLSFHVDYWDRLGWKDPFSTNSYSERQRQYAQVMNLNGVYTPQIVVNGSAEFVGSDKPKLDEAISNALSITAKSSFTKLDAIKNDKKLYISYTLSGDLANAEIHFARLSQHESTNVKRGENVGRQLIHTNVVKEFITVPASETGKAELNIDKESQNGNSIVIAYLQRKDNLHIIAAAAVKP